MKTTLNFPLSNIYDNERNAVYMFYRQGMCYIDTLHKDTDDSLLKEQLSPFDIGNPFIYKNEIIILMSAQDVCFYRIKTVSDAQYKYRIRMFKYFTIDIQGYVFGHRFSNKFRIVTPEKVYFYEFNEKDIPTRTNVMYNFMQADSIEIDIKSNVFLTYKKGQPDLQIIKRKFDHGFQEFIDKHSKEGHKGVEIPEKGMILVSYKDSFVLYDNKTYQPNENFFKMPLKDKEKTDDPLEILTFSISPDKELVAVLIGKNLIKQEEELHQLLVFQVNSFHISSTDLFEMKNNIRLSTHFRHYCKEFMFHPKSYEDEIVMVSKDKIVRLNFKTGAENDIYVFKNKLAIQPDYFKMNQDMNMGIVASNDDVLIFNIENG